MSSQELGCVIELYKNGLLESLFCLPILSCSERHDLKVVLSVMYRNRFVGEGHKSGLMGFKYPKSTQACLRFLSSPCVILCAVYGFLLFFSFFI